jgi:trehalose-6-phosphate synthase
MRITLRLILVLIVGITAVSLLFAYFQVEAIRGALRHDLDRRASLLAESLEEAVVPLLETSQQEELLRLVERFGNREHLAGVVVYDREGKIVAITNALSQRLKARPDVVFQVINGGLDRGQYLKLGNDNIYLYALPLHHEGGIIGALAIFHEVGYIDTQVAGVWRETILRVAVMALLVVLATGLIVRWSIEGPIAQTVQWMRKLRAGEALERPTFPDGDLFKPLARELTSMARSLEAARAAVDEKAVPYEPVESIWTAERLRFHVQSKLQESPLFVVSNREPCMHVRQGKSVEAIVPAGGLIAALGPIMHACDGTWIAHGAGDADREVVDEHDRLRVPPEDPHYTLRRVWLSKEEEEGYYFGFANEGMWPLCHIAHTRPTFRTTDWEQYRAVNHKFGNAVLTEMSGTKHPTVLIQDYHFALLPRIVKEARPDARVAIFWHIPWPNPQVFGICPWQRELVDGLLGADLVGFHIQAHCNHFLETVDQALECRIEWDRFAVNRRGHFTLVRPFPASVDLLESPPEMGAQESPYLDRAALFKELGVEAVFMGVGVDRVDYTKGIPERFRGIERFLEKYPAYQGQFTFVEIGAPSRTHIKRYHDLLAEVESEAERINWRFQTGRWKPIVFLKRHHTHREIERYFRTADLCMVTSLHDGMNLVAKEFVASRHDGQGALILSRFAGACRELRDALVVNPYDTEQLAEAIRFALEMDPEERKARMERMRKIVKERNVYRWAANLIAELSEVRPEKSYSPRKTSKSAAS